MKNRRGKSLVIRLYKFGKIDLLNLFLLSELIQSLYNIVECSIMRRVHRFFFFFPRQILKKQKLRENKKVILLEVPRKCIKNYRTTVPGKIHRIIIVIYFKKINKKVSSHELTLPRNHWFASNTKFGIYVTFFFFDLSYKFFIATGIRVAVISILQGFFFQIRLGSEPALGKFDGGL